MTQKIKSWIGWDGALEEAARKVEFSSLSGDEKIKQFAANIAHEIRKIPNPENPKDR